MTETSEAHSSRPRTGRALLAAVLVAVVITVGFARPAAAAILWDGNASKGFGVFAAVLCDGGSATVTDWNDGHGAIFSLNKPVGSDRCEVHSINDESRLGDNRTLWFGWDLNTKTGNAQTVFQWKSNGTNDQHQQNYPVIMKVEDGRLRVWYVAPGETWIGIGSAAWTPGTWNAIQLGITTSSGSAGSIEVYLNGTRIAARSGVRTWDDLGNKPRWGTYGATIANTESHVWVDDPRLGTDRGSVS
ncbi:heparin lyase I family protein [Microlunatus sp. GCM10028923]|uniref:heparin lyase I family protein n=1 Tax=Microlunatus sp. GCM10028923 TaxID=3273400 RepID=UPI00361CAE92